MKKKYIFIFLICFISCKQKQEITKEIGWIEFNELYDSIVLSSKFTEDNQKLFMNYHVNMDSIDFEKMTQTYIKDSTIIKSDSLLFFPIHSKMYKTYDNEYFTISPIFIKNKLKSIYLSHNNTILDAEKNEQNLFFNYKSILEEKYKKPNLESYDDTFDQAFWISNGTIITLIDNKTNILINYQDVNFVKNNINISRKEDQIEENKISNLKKKELKKERLKDSLNKNSF